MVRNVSHTKGFVARPGYTRRVHRAVLALSLLATACGHGPDFPENADGGKDGGATTSTSSSSGGAVPPASMGNKPCDFANGACACFVAEGQRGCCIGGKTPLASETSPSGARIFDPATEPTGGAIDDVDVSCKDTPCHPMTGADGVLVICPGQPMVTCGCN